MILTPTADRLAEATAYLDAFLDDVGCSVKTRIALETVLEEVFMNIVNHSGATTLELTLSQDGEDVVLRFSDDGFAFNPLLQAAPNVTLSAEERSIGGLGILMIRRMTDSQTYANLDGRNLLTLTKHIS